MAANGLPLCVPQDFRCSSLQHGATTYNHQLQAGSAQDVVQAILHVHRPGPHQYQSAAAVAAAAPASRVTQHALRCCAQCGSGRPQAACSRHIEAALTRQLHGYSAAKRLGVTGKRLKLQLQLCRLGACSSI